MKFCSTGYYLKEVQIKSKVKLPQAIIPNFPMAPYAMAKCGHSAGQPYCTVHLGKPQQVFCPSYFPRIFKGLQNGYSQTEFMFRFDLLSR